MLVRPPAIPAAPDAATALVHFAERNVIKRRKQITRLDARERLRDLGSQEVKGIAEPVVAWMVEGVSASESRFEAVHAAGLTDLIGREDELDFLLERQWLAWKGEGQIVLISGEPGIGKSPWPLFGGAMPHRHHANASSKTLACFRSSVSKPSVNQPYTPARRSRAC